MPVTKWREQDLKMCFYEKKYVILNWLNKVSSSLRSKTIKAHGGCENEKKSFQTLLA
jgi:hypothetical protein